MGRPPGIRSTRSHGLGTAFRWLWTSQVCTLAGLGATHVAMPVLLYQRTGSAATTAGVVATSVLPYTVFGLIAGAVADRVDRQRLMVACDLVNAVVLASVPLALLMGGPSILHVYVVALLSGTLWVWSDAGFFGAVPAAVGRAAIGDANGRLYSARMALGIVTPAAVGGAIAIVSPAFVFAAAAVLLVGSAACVWCVRVELRADRSAQGPTTLREDLREGLAFVWNHDLIRPLTLLGVGNSLSGGAVMGLLVVYGVEALGLATDDPRLGTLYSAGAIGALLAALSLSALVRRLGVARVTLLGLPVHLLALLALVPLSAFPAALVVLFVWQGAYLLVIVNGITIRQQVTPDALQGRVNATARTIATIGAPLGGGLGAAVAGVADVRVALVVAALGVAVSAVVAWLSPLREMARGSAPA